MTLEWEAMQTVDQAYKVFVHVLGPDGLPIAQEDNEPVNGTRPTSTWHTGEVIMDSYAIPLAPQAPAGHYTIEIGLYDPATGNRLSVLHNQGANHLVLAHVTVESE